MMNNSRLLLRRFQRTTSKNTKRIVLEPTRVFSRVMTRVISRDFSTQTKQDILVLNAGSSSLKFNLFSVNMGSNSVSSVLNGAANGNLYSFR